MNSNQKSPSQKRVILIILSLFMGFGLYTYFSQETDSDPKAEKNLASNKPLQNSELTRKVKLNINESTVKIELENTKVLNQKLTEEQNVTKEYVKGANGIVKPTFLGDEILIKFHKEVSTEEIRSLILQSLNIDYGYMGADSTYRLIKLNKLQSVESALSYFSKLPQVEKAQPNFVYKMTSMPDDSFITLQWGLKNFGQTVNMSTAQRLEPEGFVGWTEKSISSTDEIGKANPGTSGMDIKMEEAWSITNDCATNKDGSPVIVAVLDTGINYEHPELQGNMWDGGQDYPHHGVSVITMYGEGEVTDIKNPLDQKGHGTSMAGIIGALPNNQKGIAGICGKAKIMAVKIGNRQGTTSSISTGMDFAINHGAKVLNMSLAIQSANLDKALEEAVQRAKTKGALIIASAGNESLDNDLTENNIWPCNFSKTYDNVFCVAAVDAKFDLGFFSSYGLKSVQLAAPGLNILTLSDGNASQEGYTLVTTQASNLKSNPTDDKVSWAEVKPQGEWKFLSKPTSGAFNILIDNYPTPISPSTMSYTAGVGVTVKDNGNTSFTGYTPSNENLLITRAPFLNEKSDPADDFKICMKSTMNLAEGDSVSFFYQVMEEDGLLKVDKLKLLKKFTGDNPENYSCYDIIPCLNNQCIFGMFLTSTASDKTGKGAIVSHINLVQKTRDTAATVFPTTELVSGTSPAAAFVSGVAAMLFAYNGNNFNYLDVKKALIEGGTSMPDLKEKIESGKVLNALGSLTYIAPPTGVKAVVDSK